MLRKLFPIIIIALTAACGGNKEKAAESQDVGEVNVYTHRHYEVDQQLFASFTEQTGIAVNVINASADELIQRMEMEGADSPADVLITVDAGRLHRAKSKDLLQPITSTKLEENVPAKFRDPDGNWYALTYRARIMAYSNERVDPADLSTYEALTAPEWAGKVLIRSSGNIYNQSLLASLIVANGEDLAKTWAEGVVANMARDPKGNDRDQVKAVAAGEGDLAIVNTYYVGRLLNSENEEEVKAGQAISIFYPNQDGRGTHINISGAGVAKYAPNLENAIKFIEFLSDEEAQRVFAHANYEFPIKPGIDAHELLQSWGEFKSDSVNLARLGEENQAAVKIFDEVGWK